MKQFIILATVLCFLSSCKKETHVLEIDMLSLFNEDMVSVAVDEKEIYFGEVTTSTNEEYGISNVTSTRSLLPDGRHTITITVNDTLRKTEQFTAKGDVYIVVYYNEADGTISLEYQNEPISLI